MDFYPAAFNFIQFVPPRPCNYSHFFNQYSRIYIAEITGELLILKRPKEAAGNIYDRRKNTYCRR